MKLQAVWFASAILSAIMTACTATDTLSVVEAGSAPGLTSPFTPNCNSIKIDTKIAGQISYFGMLNSNQTRISKMPGFPAGTTLMAICLDVEGKMTGSTTIGVSSDRLTAGSSEGSTVAVEYAKIHDTTGVFPIVTVK